MKLRIRTLKNETFEISCQRSNFFFFFFFFLKKNLTLFLFVSLASDTLEQVKAVIEREKQHPVAHQKLIYNGVILVKKRGKKLSFFSFCVCALQVWFSFFEKKLFVGSDFFFFFFFFFFSSPFFLVFCFVFGEETDPFHESVLCLAFFQ